MASNPNMALKNRHRVLCAVSGGYKTTAIMKMDELKRARRVIFFDPYGLHKKIGCRTILQTHSLKAFTLTLHRLMRQKRPFVVSLVGMKGVKALDVFAQIIWHFADGNKETHVVIEELLRCVRSVHSLQDSVKELWQGGRQFGLIMITLFQRAQEVPKSIVNQAHFKWVGQQDSIRDAEYWSKEIDVPVADILALKEGEFYLKESGQPPQFGTLRRHSSNKNG
ncbi:hypothetical protein [Vibrio coralliilyticus]|uniref:hypothetical protein n=1 Tax=Vibrio coralliilyticus TaxID=190893 RepID=UPI0018385836|nr:hypothetical protein [Vibrio coralliilyticus]NUW69559.1 hypothetical protein [Vibrio coralliilyticus]